MRKKYESPRMEVLQFESEDIMTVSGMLIVDDSGVGGMESFSNIQDIFSNVI